MFDSAKKRSISPIWSTLSEPVTMTQNYIYHIIHKYTRFHIPCNTPVEVEMDDKNIFSDFYDMIYSTKKRSTFDQ